MQWWICAHWFIEALRFALLIEEAVLVALCNKEIKLEVAPRELHAARDRCPFAESDRFIISGAIGKRIATDNILLQHVSEAFFIANRTILFVNLANHLGK